MPAIVDLHVACWRHNFKGMIRQSALDSLDPAQWLERRLARVDDPGLIQLVALDGHSVLGFCTGGASREPLFSEAGEVHALFVGLQFQGQGVGIALFREMLGRLRGRGFASIIVKTLLANPSSRKFYEKTGCMLVGESAFSFGGDSYPEAIYLCEQNENFSG
jgi:GNAT superfamily N-acetyltransferase